MNWLGQVAGPAQIDAADQPPEMYYGGEFVFFRHDCINMSGTRRQPPLYLKWQHSRKKQSVRGLPFLPIKMQIDAHIW
jgi:hypothetical protein